MYELNTRSSDSIIGSCLLFFIGGGIALALVIGIVLDNPHSTGLYIGIGVLGLIAFIGFVNMIQNIRKRMIIATPRIAISARQAKSGDTLDLVYEQKFKARTNVKTLQMQVVLREKATYTQGTDTYTVSHDHVMQDISLPPQVFRRGEHLQRNWKINIPSNAMHTFKANNNNLLWLILIKLEFNRNMKSNYESEITVLPQNTFQL